MADIAVTNSSITAYNTITTVTANLATEGTNDTVQKFVITPTKADCKVLVLITVANTHGTVTYSAAAGGLWAAVAVTGSVVQNTTKAILFEGGKVKSATGTIEISFTPASGKDLTNDHAMNVEVIELPL